MTQQKFEVLGNTLLTYTVNHDQTTAALTSEEGCYPGINTIVKEELEQALARAAQRIDELDGVSSGIYDVESVDTEPSNCF